MKMKHKMFEEVFCQCFCKLIVIYSFLCSSVIGSLTDVTSDSLGSNAVGVIAAFGDFNADKHVDIFLIVDNGKKLKLLLASSEDVYEQKELVNVENNENCSIITGVIPGDFNGDNQMDILIACQSQGQTDLSVHIYIYWGSQHVIGVEKNPFHLPDKLVDQPLILDTSKNYTESQISNGSSTGNLNPLRQPQSSAFVDLNGDLNAVYNGSSTGNLNPGRQPQSSAFVDLNGYLYADLCVFTERNGKPQLEIWYRNTQDDGFKWGPNILPDLNMKVYGQASFVDLDENGVIDILIPACKDDQCTESFIFVHPSDQSSSWYKLPVNFKSLGDTWGFVPFIKNAGINYNVNTLRMGDFNLDGFPDILTVLQNTTSGNGTKKAFILYNVPCSGKDCKFSRTFQISWDTSFHSKNEQGLLPAFYDYQENGILDVIITTQAEDKSYKIHLWKQTFTEDACFLKVIVLSGLCLNNCPYNRQPYGVNQPGPAIEYNTLDNNGDPQTGIACQLTQSAHFSLQLPFSVFGLGQTPNFVDELRAGIPTYKKVTRTKAFKAIIPNSQLVIIPYPLDYPSSWSYKLFVTPSRLVLLTGAALLGTCGFIAGIVGILQWREKVEDKKEKLQEAHKFHFDAM